MPFNDDWHDANRVMFDPEDTSTPLIYYQPVLLFGAALQVGVKGKIANRKSKEEARRGHPGMNVGDDDDQPSSLTAEQKNETGTVTPQKFQFLHCYVHTSILLVLKFLCITYLSYLLSWFRG